MMPATREQVCPQCGARLASDGRFVVWCQGCEWNLDPEPPPARSRIRRMLAARADRLARQLSEQVRAHPESERRGVVAAILGWLFAGAVHLVTLALAVLAVRVLVAFSFPWPVRVMGAA